MKKIAATLAVAATATAIWLAPGKAKKQPPAPLSADSLAALAEIDSFPTIVPRDTAGRSTSQIAVGDSLTLCALGRNRYTGEVRIFVAGNAPIGADSTLATLCENARLRYAAERSG